MRRRKPPAPLSPAFAEMMAFLVKAADRIVRSRNRGVPTWATPGHARLAVMAGITNSQLRGALAGEIVERPVARALERLACAFVLHRRGRDARCQWCHQATRWCGVRFIAEAIP